MRPNPRGTPDDRGPTTYSPEKTLAGTALALGTLLGLLALASYPAATTMALGLGALTLSTARRLRARFRSRRQEDRTRTVCVSEDVCVEV